MNDSNLIALDGGCTCGRVRRASLYVHCCHCRWCQRETGAAFALNAMIESSYVKLLSGDPVQIETPSNSGKGQKIVRCPSCQIAVWSHYAGAGDALSFVRVGTLDEPDALPPDIHIYTASKQAWVNLPSDKPAFEAYYQRSEQMPAISLQRLADLQTKIDAPFVNIR